MNAFDTPAPTPIRPYLVRFVIAYLAALALVALIIAVLSLSSGGSGAAAAALISAATYTAGKFVNDTRRAPSQSERRRLVWSSLAIAMTVQLGFTLLLVDRPNPGVMLVVSLLIGAIYWLGLRFAYSEWMAKRTLQGIEKRQTQRGSKQV